MVMRGERRMESYCRLKLGEVPYFCESFAHIGGLTIERIYEKAPEDYYWEQFFIFYNRYGSFDSALRSEIHSRIREGTMKFDKVLDYYKDIKGI